MIVLNVPFIFELAGGTAGLLAMIREDFPDAALTYPAVQMWRQRVVIPGVWIAPVLCALSRRGHAMGELLTTDDPFGVPGIPGVELVAA